MRKHPVEYRTAEVARIMQCWRASESCSLVGVGSVGKSNLLQHLLTEEVQKHYLPEEQVKRFVAINIDPNMLGPFPDTQTDTTIRVWAGYELMMHRLFLSFYPFDMLSAEEARQFYATYQALQDGTNPLYAYMGIRYFELGLEFFLRHGFQIVFMFDEFEEMLRQLPVKFFQTLRGLRDQHKGQLSYLTFTRTPLDVVATRLDIPALDIEPFRELFNDNVVYVGPYSSQDARRMVAELATRRDIELTSQWAEALVSVTGGFAGLLRAALHHAEQFMSADSSEDALVNMTAILARRPSIQLECQTIWDSLSVPEQIVLLAIARLSPYSVGQDSERAVSMLLLKKLVRFDRKRQLLEIQPALFRVFVEQNETL